MKTRWFRAILAGLLYSLWLWAALWMSLVVLLNDDKLKTAPALLVVWFWSVCVIAAIYAVVLRQPAKGGKG